MSATFEKTKEFVFSLQFSLFIKINFLIKNTLNYTIF